MLLRFYFILLLGFVVLSFNSPLLAQKAKKRTGKVDIHTAIPKSDPECRMPDAIYASDYWMLLNNKALYPIYNGTWRARCDEANGIFRIIVEHSLKDWTLVWMFDNQSQETIASAQYAYYKTDSLDVFKSKAGNSLFEYALTFGANCPPDISYYESFKGLARKSITSIKDENGTPYVGIRYTWNKDLGGIALSKLNIVVFNQPDKNKTGIMYWTDN